MFENIRTVDAPIVIRNLTLDTLQLLGKVCRFASFTAHRASPFERRPVVQRVPSFDARKVRMHEVYERQVVRHRVTASSSASDAKRDTDTPAASAFSFSASFVSSDT